MTRNRTRSTKQTTPKSPRVPGTSSRRHRPVDRSQQGAALSGFSNVPEKILQLDEKSVDSAGGPVVESPQSTKPATEPVNSPATKPVTRSKAMTLTLKGLSKNGKTAFYTGAAQVARFPLGMFVDKTAPSTIEVADDVFAPVKAVLTAAERKAIKDAKPKPTLAERIAQRRKALEALEAKAAAEQPSL